MANLATATGWKLPSDERERLLRRFPPKYENVIADHVTLRVGATPETPLPPPAPTQIVGRSDDRKSLENGIADDFHAARHPLTIYARDSARTSVMYLRSPSFS